MQLLGATFSHMKKPYQLLIIPLTFWSGVEQGFFGADFTAVGDIIKIRFLIFFENHPKCRILTFEFWHFPSIFVQLKLTCLATLFDRKIQFFKNSQN